MLREQVNEIFSLKPIFPSAFPGKKQCLFPIRLPFAIVRRYVLVFAILNLDAK